jgi:hypothetical protein
MGDGGRAKATYMFKWELHTNIMIGLSDKN